MQSLFSTETLSEIEKRIESISNETERKWGSMTPSQMLWHCKAPLILALKDDNEIKVNPLKKLVYGFFKESLYNDKPWKPNIPAPKTFIAAKEYDLEEEKKKLLELVRQFHSRKDQEVWKPHPYFGKFTKEQWGKMQFKHLDHHLRQFNS